MVKAAAGGAGPACASLDGPAAARQRRAKRPWLGGYTRGAQGLDCSMGCANWHAVMLFRTLCQVSDPLVLFLRPTGAHLAPFILQSLGRRSPPRRSCAVLRQTAIR